MFSSQLIHSVIYNVLMIEDSGVLAGESLMQQAAQWVVNLTWGVNEW